MGQEVKQSKTDSKDLRRFTHYLLNDMRALEASLQDGIIESDKRRIGAEQELVLVDRKWRPVSIAKEVLESINDPHFTPEVAKFNIEFNLDPLPFEGDCLSILKKELVKYVEMTHHAAKKFDAEIVLTGILPTIRKSDLTLENMTERERYFTINDALARMRGAEYELDIKGTDELKLTHDNLMLEAANTSFQVHFQVAPDEFARRYNIAQAAVAPVLAAAVNSPFLGRYRLWRETRIAVFQQSIDTRTGPFERKFPPRVHFGNDWIKESVLEIFREDIAHYKVLFAVDKCEDPFEALEAGRVPELQALKIHNGTIYRWNRACYGISEGKPHLRIENRVLPSVPTIEDEVANAAFWFGLMSGMSVEYEDITKVMEFDDARDNFFAAARHGLGAQFKWLDGRRRTACNIILEELLPMAKDGLEASNINPGDIDRFLGVIEQRVIKEQTGSAWMVNSLAGMTSPAPTWEKLHAIVAATVTRQKEGTPVHEWTLALLEEGGGWEMNYTQVDQYMTSDLFTVHPHDPIDLAAQLMVWNRIRHVLVEDEEHHLVGILSHRTLLRLIGHPFPQEGGQSAPVSAIMIKDPITITPETLTLDAIRIMREKRISCLPVLKEGMLVGVVTEDSFLEIAANLLKQKLKEKS